MPVPERAWSAALEAARVYLVCDARPAGRDPEYVLRAALEAGVDLIQLRDARLDEGELLDAARTFRRLADEFAVPFLINDRPDLVGASRADGVHVGQDDAPVSEARRIAGAGAIVGLSTHSTGQLRAACEAEPPSRPDYVSVGPVWETPTKPGRPAAGLAYVSAAAERARLPWFAIGGIDPSNVGEVVAAGASRIVVVRAISDCDDPGGAARTLLAALPSAGGRQPGLRDGRSAADRRAG